MHFVNPLVKLTFSLSNVGEVKLFDKDIRL